ncbi:hypothetical protein [Sharpea azabuensis]|uniref:Type IV secretory system Conjugative DNA transfer n=1 Tax=Sharpea azabuensis TaxID=322505 RepID=A0A1H6QTL6_9FIRM|nr:hypothetical protein [Sharpea azabuensis]SEI42605.1 hypothetical protein SAMN04487834_100381 [Sharpea azabuensis]
MEKMRVGKDAYMGLPDNFGGVNHMIVGAPGSGKTRYLLEPMLLQMNTYSHLIVDIKDSLYPRLHKSLEDMAYDYYLSGSKMDISKLKLFTEED